MRPNTYRDQSLSFCKNCDYSVCQDDRPELFCHFNEGFMGGKELENELNYHQYEVNGCDRTYNPNFKEDWISARVVDPFGVCPEHTPKKAIAIQFLVPHESGKGYYAIAADEAGKFITGAIVETRNEGEADLNTAGTQHDFFCDRRFHYGWMGWVWEHPPDNWDGQKLPTPEQMQVWENRPEQCKNYFLLGDLECQA